MDAESKRPGTEWTILHLCSILKQTLELHRQEKGLFFPWLEEKDSQSCEIGSTVIFSLQTGRKQNNRSDTRASLGDLMSWESAEDQSGALLVSIQAVPGFICPVLKSSVTVDMSAGPGCSEPLMFPPEPCSLTQRLRLVTLSDSGSVI